MNENIEVAELKTQLSECQRIISAQAEEIAEYRRLQEARDAHNEMLVLRAKKAEGDRVSVPDGLIVALRNQRQIDNDGSEVAVSRQAVDEAAGILESLTASTPVGTFIGEGTKAGSRQPGVQKLFTYSDQPGNLGAWRLGEACSKAAKTPGGDYIDGGLSLLKELQAKGYGIVALDLNQDQS